MPRTSTSSFCTTMRTSRRPRRTRGSRSASTTGSPAAPRPACCLTPTAGRAAGLLVSPIEAFARYQDHDAWVWEHQALSRARHSAGDPRVGEAFEAIRERDLKRKRGLPVLAREILSMRDRMHAAHPNNSGLFDVKHDAGGMIDIEFTVQ